MPIIDRKSEVLQMNASKLKDHATVIQANTTVIRCAISRGGSIVGLFNMDMVMISGNPHVVFKGRNFGGCKESVHLVAIDPDWLDPLPNLGDIKWLYRIPVEDPRASPPPCVPSTSYTDR
jgi:hypothetical protein